MSDAGHSKKTYLQVAVVLTVLTGIEVGVVYTPIPRSLMIAVLIGLALSKALTVAMFYMHLKYETRYLRWILGLPMLFPPLYAVVLMLEAFWHTPLYR